MELTWIEDFLALADTRNFTLAAEQCATTQPAFSRRLKRLEDWMGCVLVDRETRPVTLTPAGDVFLPRAKRLREDMLDAQRITRLTASHYQRPVRIYTTNTLAIGFFPSLVQQGDLRNFSLVVASTSACLDAVRDGRATSALIPVFPSTLLPAGFKTSVAGNDQVNLFARTDVAARITVENGKIFGPLLMYTPLTAYGVAVTQLLTERGLDLAEPPLCESASAEALAAQADVGMGAAWLPRSIVPPTSSLQVIHPELSCAYHFALVSFPKEETP